MFCLLHSTELFCSGLVLSAMIWSILFVSILFYSILCHCSTKENVFPVLLVTYVPEFNLHPLTDIFNSLTALPTETDRVMQRVVAVNFPFLCHLTFLCSAVLY